MVDRFDNEVSILVRYDDDGSTKKLERSQVRLIAALTIAQTNFAGPLSDADAFGGSLGEFDDKISMQFYDLKAELAFLKEKAADLVSATRLYDEAAEGAIADGKMGIATKWSLKVEYLGV